MFSHRSERAGSFLLEEITRLLRDRVHDPRVQAMTVTDVELTPDRRIARVFVAAYSGEEALQEGLKGLESAKGFLRRELSQLLHWRFMPEIEFRVDRSFEYGAKIDEVLREIDLSPSEEAGESADESDDESTDESSD